MVGSKYNMRWTKNVIYNMDITWELMYMEMGSASCGECMYCHKFLLYRAAVQDRVCDHADCQGAHDMFKTMTRWFE